MADESEKENQNPCLLDLYLETEDTVEDKTTPEEGQKFLDTTMNNLNADLVDVLNKYTQGHSGLSLFHTLRSAHLALASQLGLVEGWMAMEMVRNNVDLDPGIIHAERGEQLQSGFDHAHMHLCTAHNHDETNKEDEDDEPMVH